MAAAMRHQSAALTLQSARDSQKALQSTAAATTYLEAGLQQLATAQLPQHLAAVKMSFSSQCLVKSILLDSPRLLRMAFTQL